MRDCLDFEPSARPELAKLLEHKWLAGSDNPAMQLVPCPSALRVSCYSRDLVAMFGDGLLPHMTHGQCCICAGANTIKHP